MIKTQYICDLCKKTEGRETVTAVDISEYAHYEGIKVNVLNFKKDQSVATHEIHLCPPCTEQARELFRVFLKAEAHTINLGNFRVR